MKKAQITIFIVVILFLCFIFLEQKDGQSAVNWSGFDYTIAFILLVSTGLSIELIIRQIKSKKSRVIIIIGIIAALVLIWAELAVGIFNSPFAGD